MGERLGAVHGDAGPGQSLSIDSVGDADAGSISSIGVQIAVTGSNFITSSAVVIGSQALATRFQSSTSLLAVVPTSLVAAAGQLPVSVNNPRPGGGTSAATVLLTVGNLNPVPTLSGISVKRVASGSGSYTLTLSGSNFLTQGQAFWGSTALVTNVSSETSAGSPCPATSPQIRAAQRCSSSIPHRAGSEQPDRVTLANLDGGLADPFARRAVKATAAEALVRAVRGSSCSEVGRPGTLGCSVILGPGTARTGMEGYGTECTGHHGGVLFERRRRPCSAGTKVPPCQRHVGLERTFLDGPGGQRPRPAHRSGLATLNGTIVLFGANLLGIPQGDTSVWNGSAWNPQSAAGDGGVLGSALDGPSAREAYGVATLNGKVVLFGGTPQGPTFLNDTWEWDGVTWAPRNVMGPSARGNPAMTALGGNIFLFGGLDLSGTYGDTWKWDGTTWVQLDIRDLARVHPQASPR